MAETVETGYTDRELGLLAEEAFKNDAFGGAFGEPDRAVVYNGPVPWEVAQEKDANGTGTAVFVPSHAWTQEYASEVYAGHSSAYRTHASMRVAARRQQAYLDGFGSYDLAAVDVFVHEGVKNPHLDPAKQARAIRNLSKSSALMSYVNISVVTEEKAAEGAARFTTRIGYNPVMDSNASLAVYNGMRANTLVWAQGSQRTQPDHSIGRAALAWHEYLLENPMPQDESLELLERMAHDLEQST